MTGSKKTAQEWLEQGKEDLKRGWVNKHLQISLKLSD